MGNIDRYPTYKGGKVTEVVVYVNYIGIHRFYRYVVNIGRWSPYEGGQLDRFHCTSMVVFSDILMGVYHRLTWHIPEDKVMSTMSGSHTGQIQWHQDTAAVL